MMSLVATFETCRLDVTMSGPEGKTPEVSRIYAYFRNDTYRTMRLPRCLL